jgi:uncharacterized protein
MSAQGAQPASPATDHDRLQARRRSWWWVAAGVAIVLAAAVVLELWERPPGWLGGTRRVVVAGLHWVRVHWVTSAALGVVVSALGVVVTLLVYRLQRRAEQQRDRRDEAKQLKAAQEARAALLRANCWVDEATGWFPRVGQATDPIALGVHPAAEVEDADVEGQRVDLPAEMPVYVPRDKDAELDAKLARGGLVLVVGDSTAGKSRAAYEAIHRLFGQRFLLVPHRRQSLRALLDGGVELRGTVVWLNDLERWLGADGLDLGLLRRLLGDGRRQVVVTATMRASEYAARSPDQERSHPDAEQELRRVEREVLDQAARVDLARRFSESERKRATERAWDPRITDALAHAGVYGLAEYMAAGPRLWRRWRDGLAVDNPPERLAGAAIVSVAVDCRRGGLDRPVSEALLRDLYLGYVDASVARRLGPEAFGAGLTWAVEPVQATSALLVPGDNGWMAFDYLVDRIQADPGADSVPEATWTRLLVDLHADDAFSVGSAAFLADRPRFAEQAWRIAADAGHHDAEYNLGTLLGRRGDLNEAELWLRKAADAGHHGGEGNLGLLLKLRGDLDEAELWLRKAADASRHEAELNLGLLLDEQGRTEEAEHWYRRAAAAGHHDAENNLGTLLAKRGDLDEAEPWLRKAATVGDHGAEGNLGTLLAERGDLDEAEQWLRKAADAGRHDADFSLGLLLDEQGRTEEAEHWYRRAAAASDHNEEVAARAEQKLRDLRQ